jgi:hypothetical protein
MSLYFSAAVWASLALCACSGLENHLPRYRTEATVVSRSSPILAADLRQGALLRVAASTTERRRV